MYFRHLAQIMYDRGADGWGSESLVSHDVMVGRNEVNSTILSRISSSYKLPGML